MVMRLSFLLLSLVGAAQGFRVMPVATAHRLHRPAAASYAVRSVDAPQMGLMDLLKTFFYKGEPQGKKSSSAGLSRLKVVLAHDRSGIDAETMEKIRAEIQEVVAKYAVLEEQNVDLNIINDDRLTVLTATFPVIRMKSETLQVEVGAPAAVAEAGVAAEA